MSGAPCMCRYNYYNIIIIGPLHTCNDFELYSYVHAGYTLLWLHYCNDYKNLEMTYYSSRIHVSSN